jgi:hypothetical protein
VTESLACIDFTDVEPALGRGTGVLANCEFFRLTRARTGHAVPTDRGRVILPITETHWAGTALAPGTLTLAPAGFRGGAPTGDWLEIEIPGAGPA